MPTVQPNGRMIGVADSALNISDRVSLQHLPSPFGRLGFAPNQSRSLCFSQSVGVTEMDVDGRSASAIEQLAVMRLAGSASQWFVPQDQS